MVLEYFRGQDISRYLNTHQFDEKDTSNNKKKITYIYIPFIYLCCFFEGFLISNIFLGLEYLHERNIVHLGIHPKHILINNDGYYKLIVFKSMNKVLVKIN